MEECSKTGCENDGKNASESKEKCRPTWRHIFVLITALIQDAICIKLIGKNCLCQDSNHASIPLIHLSVLSTELLIEPCGYNTNNTISFYNAECTASMQIFMPFMNNGLPVNDAPKHLP